MRNRPPITKNLLYKDGKIIPAMAFQPKNPMNSGVDCILHHLTLNLNHTIQSLHFSISMHKMSPPPHPKQKRRNES